MAINTLPDPPGAAAEPVRPPMPPDIRERAERLNQAASNAETRVELLDILSQALLEAHNAGRAEAVEWLETRSMQAKSAAAAAGAEGNMMMGVVHMGKSDAFAEAATAIRSIK